MRKLFGTTQYVKIGEDVEPNEEYLQLNIKNIWDGFGECINFYKDSFTYYVTISKRTNNHGSYTAKKAKQDDLSSEEIKAINSYLNT